MPGVGAAKSNAADMRHADMGHVAMGIAEDGNANVSHADMGDAAMNQATLIWISACKGTSGSPVMPDMHDADMNQCLQRCSRLTLDLSSRRICVMLMLGTHTGRAPAMMRYAASL